MGTRYGLEIRAAVSGDAPGLAAMLAEAAIAIAPAEFAGRLEALQREGGTALVAVEWGPPSGLVVLSHHRTLDSARPVGLVTTLLVARDSRRRGIGRVLLKAAARTARRAGCERMLLTAEPGQADLRAFCTATGFAQAGTILTRPLLRRGSAEA